MRGFAFGVLALVGLSVPTLVSAQVMEGSRIDSPTVRLSQTTTSTSTIPGATGATGTPPFPGGAGTGTTSPGTGGGSGTVTPGFPSTGQGGEAMNNLIIIASSGTAAALGIYLLVRGRKAF